MPIRGLTNGIPVAKAGGSCVLWVSESRTRKKTKVASKPDATRATDEGTAAMAGGEESKSWRVSMFKVVTAFFLHEMHTWGEEPWKDSVRPGTKNGGLLRPTTPRGGLPRCTASYYHVIPCIHQYMYASMHPSSLVYSPRCDCDQSLARCI